MSAYEGDAAAIGKLISHWGEAYVITYANGLYHAERRDNGAQVRAPTLSSSAGKSRRTTPHARYPGSFLSGR